LPLLLERCLHKGWRALVRGTAAGRLEALDAALWSYRAEAFLPHGREGQEARGEPARNPIWLTTGPANPNGAKALFLIDGAGAPDAAAFQRTCHVFSGDDAGAVVNARARWREGKAAGFSLAFWRENEAGGWHKAAGD
jgi:DNA polymerase III subunit chi